MRANTEELLGTLLGIQKGFGYCPIEVRVAISDNGIIERGYDEPRVLKADMIPESISQQLKEMKSACSLLSPKLGTAWLMKQEEAKRVAHFLVACHRPLTKEGDAKTGKKPTNQPSPGFVPRVGGICPKCQKHPLERGSIKRMDGTETDYLRCTGYPHACDAIFPLVAMPISANGAGGPAPDAAVPYAKISSVESPILKDGDACPRCKTGKLVHRKGNPDFLGCKNYSSKPSCRFTTQLDNSERA